MAVSVVIPTYNQRAELEGCLDALAANANEVAIIVVNGPSTDGTSGMVMDRSDVDVLLESSSRNPNVAWNLGLREAETPLVALLSPEYCVSDGWDLALRENLEGAADVATGPVRPVDVSNRETPDEDELPLSAGNLGLTTGAVTALDGFDEYLLEQGIADLASRIAGLELQTVWDPRMSVDSQHAHGADTDRWSDHATDAWGQRYRATGYRVVKNNGLELRVLGRLAWMALRDGVMAASGVVHGDGTPTRWIGTGQTVVQSLLTGIRDGHRARAADRTTARNPNGLSRGPPTDGLVARHERSSGDSA